MKSITRTLMLWLSLAGAAIFVVVTLALAVVRTATSWNPDKICRAAIPIVAHTLTRGGPAAALTFSGTKRFAALSANSPGLWFAASRGAERYEFSPERRPQLPFELGPSGSTTAVLANHGTGHVICFEQIRTMAAEPLVLTVAGAQPSLAMSVMDFFKSASSPLAMVALAFAAVVAAGVFFAGRFVRLSIARVTRMAVAIDPAAPQGSIPLDQVPAELKTLVASLNGAFDQIAAFMDRQRRFIGNTAHELRTPLAILRTKLEAVPDSELRAALVLDTRRLASLVAAMLDLSRLTSDALPRKPVDLADIARDVLADYGPLALDRGMDLSLVSDADGPVMILGSAEAIRSAIANLVGNALIHAHGARTIVARVSRSGAISISDDGLAGSARQPRSQGTALAPAGSGLGLSIVREIMAAHHGRLDVVAAPGGGTSVHLVFGDGLSSPSGTSLPSSAGAILSHG